MVEEVQHDGWVELVLDRADRRNALSTALADELIDALARATSTACAAVLSARGPVFCAGADLSEGMSLAPDRPSARVLHALAASPLFLVAALDGGVYGAGIPLIAACPVVVATTAGCFGLPEAGHGIFPLGVVPYLESRVPRRRLLALGLEGGSIPADEALALGLVTEVVPEAELAERAQAWIARAVAQPAVAAQAKRWWSGPLLDETFRHRVTALESLLADQLPAPTAARGR